MVPYFPLTIPFGVKKLWDEWNIRGTILFSLWLQIVLILVAPIRNTTRKNLLMSLIWFSYLLADAAANFSVGLISNSQRNRSNNSNVSIDLLAFWAPFLLLHLGGPDTITAFALEDNQLWLRHLLSLGFQATAVLYVFFQSIPNNNLWIPTILIFTAGIIRYVERTRALFYASLGKFRDSMLKTPDPGLNYAKISEEYSFKRGAKLPTRICITPRESDIEAKRSSAILPPVEECSLGHLEVVHYAYHYFKIFKGLVVDLNFSFRERDESRNFFISMTAEDALRIIEVELNFIYGSLYTKMEVVYSIPGFILRLIAFGSILSSLGLFYFQEDKDESYESVDIGITYLLLLGAIALDVIAFFMLIFSDRTFASIVDRPNAYLARIFSSFLALKKPRWHHCECKIKKGDGEEKNIQHNVLSTLLAFRRWSGSIAGHNFIRYCLKSSYTEIHKFPNLWEIMFEKILSLLGINEVSCMISKVTSFLRSIEEIVIQIFGPVFRFITMPFKDAVDAMMYVYLEPFTKELWEFIFEELKQKSMIADDLDMIKRISAARGEWILKSATDISGSDFTTLMKYVSEVQYDKSILLWHIATDLCYYTDDEKENGASSSNANIERSWSHRQFSKILSDYMLYLLVFQPTMVSSVTGIGKERFEDTRADAERLFQNRSLRPDQDKIACEAILSVKTEVEPVTLKGDTSDSVLFDASILAKVLKRLNSDKWELVCQVWVELMSYAAIHCSGSTHAKQVSKGGELITFVWLLMAHFGLGEKFQDKQPGRGKLVVGK